MMVVKAERLHQREVAMRVWMVEIKNGDKSWRPTNFGYSKESAEGLREELIHSVPRKSKEARVREYRPVEQLAPECAEGASQMSKTDAATANLRDEIFHRAAANDDLAWDRLRTFHDDSLALARAVLEFPRLSNWSNQKFDEVVLLARKVLAGGDV